MRIQKVAINQLQKAEESTQTLRIGQIIHGKILKLYPNNKAHIQLGTNQLIAQLEASLEIGKRYHFQVQSKDNLIHLKVLGDSLTNKDQSNQLNLLLQLGMKTTKINQAFVGSLFEHKMAFDKGQLQQALILLEGAPDKGFAQAILREMIANKIPLTNTIFQAISARLTDSFTDHIRALVSELTPNQTMSSNIKQGILEHLHNLSGKSRQVIDFQAILKNPETVDLFKVFGVLDQDAQFTNWSKGVNDVSSGNLTDIISFHPEKVQRLVANIANLDVIQQNAVSIMNKYGDIVRTNIANGTPLPFKVFTEFSQEVMQNVFEFTKEKYAQIINNPQQLQYLLHDLEIVAKPANYRNLEGFLYQFIKESFTDQTRNVLANVGLPYEHDILHDKNPTKTLKGLLLQLVQSGDFSSQEPANKLLQFINGMQLQSVNESERFIQANLLLPAGMLGLDNDVEMQFEGRKNEAGEIDPEFCRIIFYLDLETIGNTVVDMNVQKRAISISVLNDQPLGNIANSLKPLLKEGLEKINYHLSSVTVKTLTNEDLNSTKKPLNTKQRTSYQGVDFRI